MKLMWFWIMLMLDAARYRNYQTGTQDILILKPIGSIVWAWDAQHVQRFETFGEDSESPTGTIKTWRLA